MPSGREVTTKYLWKHTHWDYTQYCMVNTHAHVQASVVAWALLPSLHKLLTHLYENSRAAPEPECASISEWYSVHLMLYRQPLITAFDCWSWAKSGKCFQSYCVVVIHHSSRFTTNRGNVRKSTSPSRLQERVYVEYISQIKTALLIKSVWKHQ